MTLYRKHRPQNFSELVGQNHISETLLSQLQKGNITHAYLFSGPRGTGKTSTARIFAKALNCLKYSDDKYGEPCNKCDNCISISEGRYLDVLEIDAASNRGIDEIRDLREKINLAPTSGKFKVYIIDEAHMLTNEAFNALLKTLEEPPAHAVFILATTEVQKIPATIASRVQKYDFGLAARENIAEKLQSIKKKEKFGLSSESLDIVASLAEGSYRDAEVLLEKVISVNPDATESELETILGKSKGDQLLSLFNLMLSKKTKESMLWLQNYLEKGGNAKVLTNSIVSQLREMLLLRVGVNKDFEKNNTKENIALISTFSKQISHDTLTKWISLFTTALGEMKDSPILSLPLELAVIEACDFQDSPDQVAVAPEEPVSEKPKEVIEVAVEDISDEVADKIMSKPVEVTTNVSKSDISAEELQSLWPDFLKKVKPHNNSLEIFLRSAFPTEFDNEVVTLEVGYRFHKDRLEEPKNNEIISSVLSEILGRPVRIKGKVSEKRIKPKSEKSEQIEEVDPVEIFGKLT